MPSPRRAEVMFGTLIPYLMLGWLDAAICLIIAALWFAAPFHGTLFTHFLTMSVFLTVVLSIGYPLSVLIRSQVGASQFALVLLPTMLLSGHVFPIDQMPALIQNFIYVNYSQYYVTIIKAIFLKGAGISSLLMPTLFLIAYALAVATPAARAPSTSVSPETRSRASYRIVIKGFLQITRDKAAYSSSRFPPTSLC